MTSTRSLATVFASLSDSRRLRLLNILSHYQVCVAYLVHALHTVQPAISRDLAILRDAELVTFERDGKWIEYRAVEPSDPVTAALFRDALKYIRQTNEAIRDLERIAKLSEGRAAALSDAPKPRKNKSQYV